MKLVTVQFDDSVDISVLPKGNTPITVSDGTVTLAGGTIMALSDVIEPVQPTLGGDFRLTPL